MTYICESLRESPTQLESMADIQIKALGFGGSNQSDHAQPQGMKFRVKKRGMPSRDVAARREGAVLHLHVIAPTMCPLWIPAPNSRRGSAKASCLRKRGNPALTMRSALRSVPCRPVRSFQTGSDARTCSGARIWLTRIPVKRYSITRLHGN